MTRHYIWTICSVACLFLCSKGFSQADQEQITEKNPTGFTQVPVHDSLTHEHDAYAALTQPDNSGSSVFSRFTKLFHGKKAGDSTVKPTDSMPAAPTDPFAFGDFSWLNGTSRKTSPPAFDSKYFTGDVTFDFNYTHSYNAPIDNTVVGSTALARNNELQLSFMGVGGDIHVNNVRGRVMMQFGTRSTVVPRN
ncbi:MAG TPA: hypothetical protein VMI35_06960, partial [Puia sp.]|nr:hypothetical protein [Puia sp.]